MKKFTTFFVAAVVMLIFTSQSAEAQHFNRGFAGPGWGGGGISINVGRGIGPAIGPTFGQPFGSNRRVGFVNPPIYRSIPVNSFYRGGFNSSFNRGYNRGVGFQYGRGYSRGCGW